MPEVHGFCNVYTFLQGGKPKPTFWCAPDDFEVEHDWLSDQQCNYGMDWMPVGDLVDGFPTGTMNQTIHNSGDFTTLNVPNTPYSTL